MRTTPNQGEFEALKDAHDAMLDANAATIAGHREWEKERKDIEARKQKAHKRETEELTSRIELLDRKVDLLEEQKRGLQEAVRAKGLEIEREQVINREQRMALDEEARARENMRGEWQLKEELVATQRRQEGETWLSSSQGPVIIFSVRRLGACRFHSAPAIQHTNLSPPLHPPTGRYLSLAHSCGNPAVDRRSWAAAVSMAQGEST